MPPHLSRLRYAEYTQELDEIIESNDEQRIGEVLTSEKYAELRELLEIKHGSILKQSPKEQKFYLEHFRTFLIFYNQ